MNDETASNPRRLWRPERHAPIKVAAIVAIAIVAVGSILIAWDLPPFRGGVERTENAYVRGRTALIAPQVSGYVVDVAVKDFQQVSAAQVLVRIDDRIYRARVDQARAHLAAQRAALANSDQAHAARTAALHSQQSASASATAQLERAKADMARVEELVRDGAVSQREYDQTRAVLRQVEAQVRQSADAVEVARQDIRTVDVGRKGLVAQVEAAEAQLRLAEIDLGNTEIRAIEAGQLGEIGVRLGQYVTNGTQLLALVPNDYWVIANYKEAQTSRMQPGQKASFTVDALGDARLTGRVERLAPAAGSEFAVLKPDNATGNFVKVPQRIGVRIAIDPNQSLAAQLRPGMSVQVSVDARD
ncbi:HlyD family secretion protein [Steroidobacter flavus]|uniref:HlyD family secretion protein n=1 Tax=Steroidobacter flavus TaxID=1842136 RepID=A0ABV8T3K3_9GAMM